MRATKDACRSSQSRVSVPPLTTHRNSASAALSFSSPRVEDFPRPYFLAVTVISICAAAEGSFVTPTVVRAGRGSAITLV